MTAGTRAARLTLDGVGITYAGTPAVAGVSMAVEPGEWVALIGPNGAGKSTLLRAVTGLVPHMGDIRVDGTAIAALPRRRRAQLVAYVPQNPEMPAAMSLFEYVLLGRTPHIGPFGVDSANDRYLCLQLLKLLGIEDLSGRSLATLSGGELQRSVLARALAQEAPVLLLDEPTSALDLGRRVEALELVDDVRRERGLTVLSVLHDLTLAGQFADRLVLLGDGRVVASGTPDEVLRDSVLSRCFGAEVRVISDGGQLLVVPHRSAGTR